VPCLPIFPAAQQQMVDLINTKLLPYSDVPGTAAVRQTAADFVNKFYSSKSAGIEFVMLSPL
jgi:hypothetical protein